MKSIDTSLSNLMIEKLQRVMNEGELEPGVVGWVKELLNAYFDEVTKRELAECELLKYKQKAEILDDQFTIFKRA